MCSVGILDMGSMIAIKMTVKVIPTFTVISILLIAFLASF
jgi:hypothetical protein